MRTAVAIDAGGTSTRAVLVDEAGTCLGLGRAGAGNPTSSGPEHAVANLVAATRQAMNAAPTVRPELVLLSAAGIMSAARPIAADAFAELGIQHLQTTGDVQSAYHSGTASPDGHVVIVGTGAIVGRMRGGDLVRVRDGIGYLLGDEGSGFWIGQAVARAVAADLDERGPRTALTAKVTANLPPPSSDSFWLRQPQLAALVADTYAKRAVELAGYARYALELPDDPVAAAIVAGAASKVLTLVTSMLDTEADDPLVLAGGLLYEGSPLAEPIRARWPDRCLRAEDGTAGAAFIALRHLGATADDLALHRIRTTLAELRAG
jgi:N-acetylglucosamine kinase-like BadF-type ATPase